MTGRRNMAIAQLKYLRAVIAVAHTGSVARAAAQLCRGPTATGRSVSAFEEAMGAPLFRRLARGMQPTMFGHRVLVRGERILAEVHGAMQAYPHASRSVLHKLLFDGCKLDLIVRVADTGSVLQAAQQLDMSRSGAGMVLARVQHQLDAPLFRRGADGLTANAAAARLIAHARRILAEMEAIGADAAARQARLGSAAQARLRPPALAA